MDETSQNEKCLEMDKTEGVYVSAICRTNCYIIFVKCNLLIYVSNCNIPCLFCITSHSFAFDVIFLLIIILNTLILFKKIVLS